jgi:hypothetical protein
VCWPIRPARANGHAGQDQGGQLSGQESGHLSLGEADSPQHAQLDEAPLEGDDGIQQKAEDRQRRRGQKTRRQQAKEPLPLRARLFGRDPLPGILAGHDDQP